jgi:phenylalanyl-tRNA synthetase beta chain
MFRNSFINLGFLELSNFSFTYENKRNNNILVINSLITEYSFLRTNLICQIIQSLEKNVSQGNKLLPIFEFGRIFKKFNNSIIKEEEFICGIFCGSNYKVSWSEKNIQLNWFQIKGFLETILISLNLSYSFSKNLKISEYYNSTNTISIIIKNEQVGVFGKINPKIAYKKKLPLNCFLFELELTKIYEFKKIKNNIIKNNVIYKQYSIFPSLTSDMSLLIPKNIDFEIIKKIIKNYGSSLLETIEIFDLYEKIPLMSNSFYSLGIKLSFRSLSKTLLKNDIDSIIINIEKALKNELDITIRN